MVKVIDPFAGVVQVSMTFALTLLIGKLAIICPPAQETVIDSAPVFA
jgi:hypothetical protein